MPRKGSYNQKRVKEYIKDYLHYDPETGIFTWIKKSNKRGKDRTGNRAGSIRKKHDDYYLREIGISVPGVKKSTFKEHQLVYLIMVGPIPKGFEIDHKNGNSLDNRWSNIRLSDKTQNMGNQGLRKNNKSGYKGVYFSTHHGKYQAVLLHSGKRYNLGRYHDPYLASLTYTKKAKELLGEFYRES